MLVGQASQKLPNLDQMRSVQPEPIRCVLGTWSQRLPESVNSFLEMIGKPVPTKVQVFDAHPRDLS